MNERPHTDRGYEEELERLRALLLEMAGRVESMIGASVRAVTRRDPELARETMGLDPPVDRLEVECDELCLQILARRQPVAGDLRFLTQSLKMVTDLERIGDIAVNICERALELAAWPSLEPLPPFQEMGRSAVTMVREAIDAFVAGDAPRARAVIAADDQVDDLYRQIFEELLGRMSSDPGLTERGVTLQSVARYLERIGDHATNLAEQVVFMLRGQDIRHPHRFDSEPSEG